MASFSSCNNWVYDVFPSFSGEDVRGTFLSHFLKELDRKLISAFKDNEIERSQSLAPVLKQAIRSSRIAVVILSEKYASSTWCLDELLEIIKCKAESLQIVIPVFYGLDPSHVRKQTGKFGEIFDKTCLRKTEDETSLWRRSLKEVANLTGYPSQNWPNEAKMIEAIANDVLSKLNISPPKDFKDFVGMDDHIAKMSVLLHLESQEVRMVGIWGTSGIGKTSIGRVLFSQLSRHFQGSVFIDRAFVSKSMEIYKNANPDDYNMKLHLQSSFLSKVLKKEDITVDSLGAMKGRLKNRKVLIVIDDLEDQMVLDTLVGQTQWFGSGSRIIVITKDKQFLRAHGIDHIYEVCLPLSKKLALEMFSRFCFRQNCPPDGLMEFASEVALNAGNLPLGLKVLGSYLRGRDKEDLIEMLPELRNGLDGKIEKTLRVSYDGLNDKKDQTIFRHIACLFNGETVNAIKMLLADSGLNVNIGLKNLVDKSLIHVREGIVEMHSLLQKMGKEIVRAQSNDPGQREFLMDSKDICEVLQYNTGTKKVLGIALDMVEIEEVHIHENAFRGMPNLLFLNIYNNKWYQKKEVRWNLQEGFDNLPLKLRLLRLDEYPMKYMPSKFCPENLVKFQAQGSKLERLWEGVQALRGLKEINLRNSIHLKEIPDLSMATNLEELNLRECSSLMKLPSSIQSLNKLEKLIMYGCSSLETLPNGINLQSLHTLNLLGCSRLNIFPNISTNISELLLGHTSIDELPSNLHFENLNRLDMRDEKYWKRNQLTPFMATLSHSLKTLELWEIQSLVEIPSSIQNFTQLKNLIFTDCINLETLPTSINLKYLDYLDLSGCSRLKTFPNISTNVQFIFLSRTGIEEVPWWIKNFTKLECLLMNGCSNLQSVSLHLSKLKQLLGVDFRECRALNEAIWNDRSTDVAMETDNNHSKSPDLDKSSSSFSQNLINSWQPAGSPKFMLLTGEEVLPYFNHRTTGSSITHIPLFHPTPSPPLFRFKVCALVDDGYMNDSYISYNIDVTCRFKNRLGNHFDSSYPTRVFLYERTGHLVIFECSFPLPEVIYDRVDIHFHFSSEYESRSGLKGWGIRLSDECSSQENQLGNRTTFPDVCEANENNMVSEVELITESDDSDEETKRSNKRIQITQEEHSNTTLPWIPLSILFIFWAVVAMFYFSDYLKAPL